MTNEELEDIEQLIVDAETIRGQDAIVCSLIAIAKSLAILVRIKDGEVSRQEITSDFDSSIKLFGG